MNGLKNIFELIHELGHFLIGIILLMRLYLIKKSHVMIDATQSDEGLP